MVKQETVGFNIVLLTENIDTSFFNQYWFITNKIYEPTEMHSSSIFRPGLSNIVSEDSQIIITPQNSQFIIKTNDLYKSYDSIKRRLLKMVEAMPLVPFRAVGLNILWKVYEESMTIPEFSRDCFFVKDSPFYKLFSAQNAIFGSYVSQNFDENTRLKLDIKPILANTNYGSEEFLLASFNYHRDILPFNKQSQVIEQMHKWSNIAQNSKKIICSLI